MIFGFNTDVQGKDGIYHVQTEDRGHRNPVVESIIYVGGKILGKKRTPYDPAGSSQEQIEEAVRHQHKELTEAIRSGTWEPSPASHAEGASPSSASLPQSEHPAHSNYRIELINPRKFHQGEYLRFQLLVRDGKEDGLAGNIPLEIRWVVDGQVADEQSLSTRADGGADIWVSSPEIHQSSALVVQANGPQGKTTVRYSVMPIA